MRNLHDTIRPGSLDDTVALARTGEARTLTPLAPRLVLGATIGEGGMGKVSIANQTALGRQVAVKTLRPNVHSDAATGLLREAWVTGALEHPNIVPIHDLGIDDSGQPMLVLKLIEGRPWADLIADANAIRATFGVDALEWNIQQLVQVCHAISFAHSRGIVHRDLKPTNVMIGAFGEVYVLDWGIAVSLVDDESGRFPLAIESRDIAGTPAYMAPEMLGVSPATEQTDVYLLGAILFEIISGQAPHFAESAAATLASIVVAEPKYPAHAPPELVAICRTAMAREPSERFASADLFRVALVQFLEHRGSAAIAHEAARQLEALEAALRTPEIDRVGVYQRFGQCRFGFDVALRSWPGNASARAGLERALLGMATYELAHGDVRAASVLLAEMRHAPPELVAKLEALELAAQTSARRIQALERLGADQDTSVGSRTRTLFLLFVGLLWSMLPLGASVFPAIEVTHGTSLVITAISLAAISAAAWRLRHVMTKTAVNRGVLVTILLFMLLHGVVEAETWALGLDMVTTQPIAIALWAGMAAAAAIFLDSALLVPTLAFLVALAVSVRSPAQRFWAIFTCSAVLLTTVIYVWHQARTGRRQMMGLADRLKATKTP